MDRAEFKLVKRPSRTVSIVTGNSNSGSACIAELFAKYPFELNVRGVFRTEEKAAPFREKYVNLEVVTGVDARDPASLVKAFQGAESALIVHPLDSSAPELGNDAQLSVNMINAAAESGVKYIVYVGSFTSVPPFDDTIIASRFKPSEALLKLHDERGIMFTVLRGGVFMENFEHSFKTIKEGSSFAAGDFQAALVYTKDIGKCAAHCLATGGDKHDGKVYNMNGSELLGPQEMAQRVSRVLGRDVKATALGLQALKVLPPPVAELYERLIKAGKDGVPQKNDIKMLIGETSTFEQFIRDNMHKM